MRLDNKKKKKIITVKREYLPFVIWQKIKEKKRVITEDMDVLRQKTNQSIPPFLPGVVRKHLKYNLFTSDFAKHRIDQSAHQIDGYCLLDEKIIVLNKAICSKERRTFTLTHEIAELYLTRKYGNRFMLTEHDFNFAASEFLMPAQKVRQEALLKKFDLHCLKHLFSNCSYYALACKLHSVFGIGISVEYNNTIWIFEPLNYNHISFKIGNNYTIKLCGVPNL